MPDNVSTQSFSISTTANVLGKRVKYNPTISYIERRLPTIDDKRRVLQRKMATRGALPRRLSKLRKIRTKIADKQGNHGPWIYSFAGRCGKQLLAKDLQLCHNYNEKNERG